MKAVPELLSIKPALPNKPLKLPGERVGAIDPRCRSGFPGVGRPW